MSGASAASRARPFLASVLGILYGLAYGLCLRYTFANRSTPSGQAVVGVMSIGFLFVVPVALGAIAVWVAAPRGASAWVAWLFLPWIPCALLVGATFLLGWEGAICLVMATPILLLMGTVGGILAGAILVYRERSRGRPALAGLALLPLLVAPVEQRVTPPNQERVVANSVDVEADAATVWSHVVRVAAIRPEEQRRTFFHRIGIPQPLEATLDHDGPGGVRQASFQGGILFRETIDVWEPERRLGFKIRVVPESVSDAVLDEHVRVGGDHFDVVYGRFRIEPLGAGRTRLHLESRHRLRTRFNFYAGLWSDAVMRDIQVSICEVIRRRCESASRKG